MPSRLTRCLALCVSLLLPVGLHAAPLAADIVVCEPVAKTPNAAVADFGAGCARWLFFTVGGRPELGQTPLWSDVERAPSEMGVPNCACPWRTPHGYPRS